MQTDNHVYCNYLDIYNNASTRHDIKIKCHITVHCHLERSPIGNWLAPVQAQHNKNDTTPNAQTTFSSYSTNQSAASTGYGSCLQRNAHNRMLRKDTESNAKREQKKIKTPNSIRNSTHKKIYSVEKRLLNASAGLEETNAQ